MARPVRIEFSGALYHVTARGDRGEDIFEDNTDRRRFLKLLGEVIGRFNWLCHAYCLMDNHYHLLIETPDGNLSKGMRQLNGVYTQDSNRRHGRVGHLFQGRYKAIVVDSDAYLLELSRYVVLNPLRAGMVRRLEKWPWSSYLAMMGKVEVPEWLQTDGLLAQFAKRRDAARRRYAEFVEDGVDRPSPWEELKGQVYLGDDRFVSRMQKYLERGLKDDVQIPRAQRRAPPPPLESIELQCADRNQAIIEAHATGAYSYQQIADYFELHFTTVGRIVRNGG